MQRTLKMLELEEEDMSKDRVGTERRVLVLSQ